MVPRIILCMGADCVEAVAEIAKASKALHEYDYVVVKENHTFTATQLKGANWVDFGWVKDSLIAGRHLPRSS